MSNRMSKAFIGASLGLWIGLMGSICLGAEMRPLAKCADGKTEFSSTGDHRGACSGHGGVVAWADGSPVKSHKPKTSYKFAVRASLACTTPTAWVQRSGGQWTPVCGDDYGNAR